MCGSPHKSHEQVCPTNPGTFHVWPASHVPHSVEPCGLTCTSMPGGGCVLRAADAEGSAAVDASASTRRRVAALRAVSACSWTSSGRAPVVSKAQARLYPRFRFPLRPKRVSSLGPPRRPRQVAMIPHLPKISSVLRRVIRPCPPGTGSDTQASGPSSSVPIQRFERTFAYTIDTLGYRIFQKCASLNLRFSCVFAMAWTPRCVLKHIICWVRECKTVVFTRAAQSTFQYWSICSLNNCLCGGIEGKSGMGHCNAA